MEYEVGVDDRERQERPFGSFLSDAITEKSEIVLRNVSWDTLYPRDRLGSNGACSLRFS